MRWGLVISFLLHAAIVLAAVIVLPKPDRFEVEMQESIPVDIVSVEEFSLRTAVSKEVVEEKPDEPPAPPKIEPVEEAKPTPEPAREIQEAAKEPTPAPTPEPQREPEPAPQAQPEADLAQLDQLIQETAEPEPAAEPEPQKQAKPLPPAPRKKPKPPSQPAEKPKPKFSTDEVAALLNKIPEEKKAPQAVSERTGTPKKAEVTSLTGRDSRFAADAADFLRQRIERCWNPPTGVQEAQNLIVVLNFSLNQDGSLSGLPIVENLSSDPLAGAAQNAAIRAVMRCQPYDGLPLDKYELWRDIRLNFDPSRMFAIN